MTDSLWTRLATTVSPPPSAARDALEKQVKAAVSHTYEEAERYFNYALQQGVRGAVWLVFEGSGDPVVSFLSMQDIEESQCEALLCTCRTYREESQFVAWITVPGQDSTAFSRILVIDPPRPTPLLSLRVGSDLSPLKTFGSSPSPVRPEVGSPVLRQRLDMDAGRSPPAPELTL
eukprot:Hpha_TRINITY_DN5186_c0_g1::TRINITY_DN5186_c0_g1_i1::g.192966::m.192966